MKNIVWVDKCLPTIELAYLAKLESKDSKVHLFTNYDTAFDFIRESKNNIDLVISGYCTYFWIETLYRKPSQEEVCFSFYNRINESYPEIKFVLFSSILDADNRSYSYSKTYTNFYSISKFDPNGMEKIKMVLFRDQSKAINMSKFKSHSAKYLLKELYLYIENSDIGSEKDHSKRLDFARFCRGNFLQILRKKKNVTTSDITSQFSFFPIEYVKIENGETDLHDDLFFKICSYLGETNEVSVFLEKLEEAYKPEVKEARYKMAKMLKNQYGIVFADSDKYEERKECKIINFKDKRKEGR